MAAPRWERFPRLGLYHPPSKRGAHTITAKSVAQGSAVDSAKVWVTDYPGMFTYHADRFRSGVNLQEFCAYRNHGTTGNVRQGIFARRGRAIHAQPLYVANLTMLDYCWR